jgi:hypothetical protein
VKRLPLLLVLGVVLVIGLAFQGAASSSGGAKVLEFDTMTPVVAPFTGRNVPAHPIRGVAGGGVPWQLAAAKGELRADGRLEIEVEGLVIVATQANPVAAFRGVVNCLTTASPDNGVNLVTDPVPATSTGDATIEADVDLPSPCVAPIVFVTNGGGAAPGAWFATTGSG